MTSLYALGFLSGFLLSSYKSSKFAAFQQDTIEDLFLEALVLKKELHKKTKKKPTKKNQGQPLGIKDNFYVSDKIILMKIEKALKNLVE